MEIIINAAIETFIATRACLTDVNIYMPPDAVVVELRKMGIEISSVTVGKRYREVGILYDERLGLWTRPVK